MKDIGYVKQVTEERITLTRLNGFDAGYTCYDSKLRTVLIEARSEEELVEVTIDYGCIIVEVIRRKVNERTQKV